MRLTAVLIVSLSAGCAGQPAQPPHPDHAAGDAVSATAAAAGQVQPAPDPELHRVKVDASNVVEVQRAGYKLVNKQGEALYCRTDTVTGSRLVTRTTCLTEQQLLDQINATKQTMEHISSHQVGPNGH